MADYAITNVARRIVYTGSAGVGPYAFTFPVLINTDIAVYKNTTLLTLTTDYTVTISGTTGQGSVTLVVAATGADRITIVGARAIQRSTDFVTGGDFFANTLNTELDSEVIFVQQVAETAERSIKAPVTDPTSINMTLPANTTRANKFLSFNSSGNPQAVDSLGTYKGNWATSTAYVLQDIVKDTSNSNIYICISAHTSTGSQPISSNADVAKWSLIVDAATAGTSATAAAASASAASTSATNAASSASAASTSASNASTSASTASTQASNASTSATNAASSASSASGSASSASTSASTATTQASNASTSATNAASSASSASTSASSASTSATNAATSATNASNSASSASGFATSASTQAGNAATSASNASTSASNAATSATNAANSYDAFDDRYLGAKSSAPSVDNDGNALLTGALYWNTTGSQLYIWTGSAWNAAAFDVSGAVTSFSAGSTGFTPNTATTGGVTLGGTLAVGNGGTGTSTAFTAGSVLFSGASGTYTQDNTNLFWDDTNNRLGIGTASPQIRFHTVGGQGAVSSFPTLSANSTAVFENNTNTKIALVNAGGAGVISTIQSYASGDTNPRAELQFASNTSSFNFLNGSGSVAPTEKMRIDSSGNVGIGTSSPSAKLQVSGTAIIGASTSGAAQVALNTGGGVLTKFIELYYQSGSPSSSTTDYGHIQAGYQGSYWTNLALNPNGGNVGIGTTAPVQKLTVWAAGTLPSTIANTQLLVGDTSGFANAGIALVTNAGNGSRLSFGSTASPLLGSVNYDNTNNSMSLSTNSTERMRIDQSGNVGIGTTSPYSQLDVYSTIASPTTGEATGVGSIRITNGASALSSAGGLEFKNAGDANGYGSKIQALNSGGSQLVFANRNASATWIERMRIDSAGNVGIGTASPTSGYKLDVAGNFKVSGSIDENVYAVVDAAGVALTPQNGTIQTWTLGASRTPTSGTWEAGESMTLMINDGTAYTVTWTTLAVTWVGGTAPTLATTGFTVIELWKVGTTIYGALVGAVA
jgi:hypothetical protein